jgi:hypothetical protein
MPGSATAGGRAGRTLALAELDSPTAVEALTEALADPDSACFPATAGPAAGRPARQLAGWRYGSFPRGSNLGR